MKNHQKRNKFFYATPQFFPDWPYPSRLAIGVNLSDFRARGQSKYRFMVRGVMYVIEREKAIRLGEKFVFKGGVLPNLIPKEEFTVLKSPKH